MKIIVTFILSLSSILICYGQEKKDGSELTYPELIPLLKNGQYGYCDPERNIIIEPQFESADFFSKDYDFSSIKDHEKKMYGESDYATVYINDDKMRIDKAGNVVYRYKAEDFEAPAPMTIDDVIRQYPFERFLNEETLLWGIRNAETGEIVLPAKYSVIWTELYSRFKMPQYALVLVATDTDKGSFYVGLNGIEYIIR